MENIFKNNDNSDYIFYQQGFGIGPFQMLNEIGKGKFGKVFLGIHGETKEKVAIKQIPKSKEIDIKSIYSEIDIQKRLIHPYLCKMYCIIETNDYIFIVNEYCSGGEIFKIISEKVDHFEEVEACKIFTQILSGLEYLHNNYICHRDIKLENMLFDEYGDAKLTDFGLSQSFEDNVDFNNGVGSPLYAAPEVLKSGSYKGTLADIWSIGICLYIMVCGEFPFEGEEFQDLVKNIIIKTFEVKEYVSPLFKDLIYKILEKNPNKRLTIQQIKNHPWMHIIDFNFMKSPGVIINKDIIPVDADVVKEIAGKDESKIINIIKDILYNIHNQNTILYYLKIEIKKRNNEPSISDIRPTSEQFLEYINDKKSKIEYYGNDIKGKITELIKNILNRSEIQKSIIKEKKLLKNESKETHNISKNTEKNKNIYSINENLTIKNVNKRLNKLRSKTFGKFDEFNQYLKKERNDQIEKEEIEFKEKKEILEKKNGIEKIEGHMHINEESLKISKLELLTQYIGPLIFIHDLIEDIIEKVVKKKYTEEINRYIPLNNSSLNDLKKKTSMINYQTQKERSFSINLIDEFEFHSTSFDKSQIYKNKEMKNIGKNNDINDNYKSLKNKEIKAITHLQTKKINNMGNALNSKINENKEEKKFYQNKNRSTKRRTLSQRNANKNINIFNDEKIGKNLKEKKNYSEKKINKMINILHFNEQEKDKESYTNSNGINKGEKDRRIALSKKMKKIKKKLNIFISMDDINKDNFSDSKDIRNTTSLKSNDEQNLLNKRHLKSSQFNLKDKKLQTCNPNLNKTQIKNYQTSDKANLIMRNKNKNRAIKKEKKNIILLKGPKSNLSLIEIERNKSDRNLLEINSTNDSSFKKQKNELNHIESNNKEAKIVNENKNLKIKTHKKRESTKISIKVEEYHKNDIKFKNQMKK